LLVVSFMVPPFDIDELEFIRSLRVVSVLELVPFESPVIADPGPVFAEPAGFVLPTPRGPAGFWVGSVVVPELIVPDVEPVLPELIEPVDEPVLPELIEPVDEPVPLDRVEPAAEPDVEPGCSGDVIVDDPPMPPIGAVWPPVEGEPVPALVAPVDPPALPVPVDCATAMLAPKASATPAAMLINLGYLLMIWLPVSILK